MDTRRMNDSLKTMRKMYADSLKTSVKIKKQETKQIKIKDKKSPNLFLLGLVVGIMITLIFKYAINQALKKLTRINL
jgi:F0F1-type ATP synthase assembly protein I